MNVVDLILVAILACVTLHFYFRKKKKALSSGKEKEKPIRGAVRKEGQERAYPVICVVFQPELEEEELDSVSVSVSVRMTVAGPLLLLV